MPITIDELRQCPEFAAAVADRIWRAWWKPDGHPLSLIEAHFEQSLASTEAKPFCLVAHEGQDYLGSALLIESDVVSRPLLAPWVAAVWVEPEHRKRGVATALLEVVVARAFELGERRIYLCCADALRPFYQARGWQLHEAGVPTAGMGILKRDF